MPSAYSLGLDYQNTWNDWIQTGVTNTVISNNIWYQWNSDVLRVNVDWSDGTQTSGYANADVWRGWNTNSITITQYQANVWNNWIVEGTGTAPTTYPRITGVVRPTYAGGSRTGIQAPAFHPQRTEEEWAAIAAENERLRAERDALQAAARAEARKLLELVLTPEQLRSYDKNKYFDVVGSEGTLFRVHHGTSGNVRQLVDGKEVNALCAHPSLYDTEGRGYLPTEDSLVGQTLALMHDESHFLRTANVHRGPRHLRVAARDGERVAA